MRVEVYGPDYAGDPGDAVFDSAGEVVLIVEWMGGGKEGGWRAWLPDGDDYSIGYTDKKNAVEQAIAWAGRRLSDETESFMSGD